MSTVQPQGEEIRKAVTWLMEEHKYAPDKPLTDLIEEAALKFNLSPKETLFLERFVQEELP